MREVGGEWIVRAAEDAVSDLEVRMRQQRVMVQMEALMMLREALRAEKVTTNRWGETERGPDWWARITAAEKLFKILQERGIEGIPKEVVEVVLHRGVRE